MCVLIGGYLSLPFIGVSFSFLFFFVGSAPVQGVVFSVVNSCFGHEQFATKLFL